MSIFVFVLLSALSVCLDHQYEELYVAAGIRLSRNIHRG